MSNIYIQEPPTSGKVLLRTTVGDIDVELWARETPKACRNFIQLCLEGYYDNTIFHRVVKGFIVQGGDPLGTGEGGESVYGHPFKDEFHSRLRFNRRGLVAMANAGKDDNSSQFFFTLGAATELQNKHTIFGKVAGDTLYNMLKLAEGLVDGDERPVYPQKVLSTEVLSNPFPDIVPRERAKAVEEDSKKKKKKERAAVKNFKLLSFGAEAEEDEEASLEASRKLSAGRAGKSAHDILQTPELSSVPAVAEEEKKLSGDEDDDVTGPTIDSDIVRNKLSKRTAVEEPEPSSSKRPAKRPAPRKIEKRRERKNAVKEARRRSESSSEEEEEEEEASKAKLKRLKEEYEHLRAQIRAEKRRETEATKEREEEEKKKEEKKEAEAGKAEVLKEFKETQEKYRKMRDELPKKGASRESFTLELLARFKNKLISAKDSMPDSDSSPKESAKEEPKAGSSQKEEGALDEDEDLNDPNWLTHKLQFDKGNPVLAKDASTKDDDWFEIYDPRNPINKRRRGADTEKGKDVARDPGPRHHEYQRDRSSNYRDQRGYGGPSGSSGRSGPSSSSGPSGHGGPSGSSGRSGPSSSSGPSSHGGPSGHGGSSGRSGPSSSSGPSGHGGRSGSSGRSGPSSSSGRSGPSGSSGPSGRSGPSSSSGPSGYHSGYRERGESSGRHRSRDGR